MVKNGSEILRAVFLRPHKQKKYLQNTRDNMYDILT